MRGLFSKSYGAEVLAICFVICFAALLPLEVLAQSKYQSTEEEIKDRTEAYLVRELPAYMAGQSDVELMECYEETILSDELYERLPPHLKSKHSQAQDATQFVRRVYVSALTKRGIDIYDTTKFASQSEFIALARAESFSSQSDIEYFGDMHDKVADRCSTQLKAAISLLGDDPEQTKNFSLEPTDGNIYNLVGDNPEDPPLFQSIVEYPPADDRITAQRCYMVYQARDVSYDGVYIFGNANDFGYETFPEFAADMDIIGEVFGAKLKAMPNNPLTNWPAINEPQNAIGEVLRFGTPSQADMFIRGLRAAFPDCLKRAKA